VAFAIELLRCSIDKSCCRRAAGVRCSVACAATRHTGERAWNR